MSLSLNKTVAVLALLFASLGVALQVTYHRLERIRDSQVAVVQSSHAAGLSRYSSLPDFSLVNRDGTRVTQADLKGRVWLASFIYTTCPNTCPMLSSRLADWQKSALAAGDVRLVSFSVDPEHDTPAVLQTYAQRFQATDRWLFLTGDKIALTKIARQGLLAAFATEPAGSKGPKEIAHSTRIALVDRHGNVRRFYDGIGPDERAQMLADLKTVLAER